MEKNTEIFFIVAKANLFLVEESGVLVHEINETTNTLTYATSESEYSKLVNFVESKGYNQFLLFYSYT